MVTTDVLLTTDMETGTTLSVARFNLWKRAYAVSENARYTVSTSTFGGTTQVLPTASSTLGAVNVFFRNKYLDFSSGSTNDWTLQTPTEDRTFIIRNRSDNDIILDTSAGASPTLTVPNAATYTVNLFQTGPSFDLVKEHVLSTNVSSTKPYAVAVYREDTPIADEVLTKVVFVRDFDVTDDFINSQAHLETAPADATWVIGIEFNSTQIGTISFTTGSTTGTFASSTTYTFSAGDIIELVAPSTADSAAGGVSLTILGSI